LLLLLWMLFRVACHCCRRRQIHFRPRQHQARFVVPVAKMTQTTFVFCFLKKPVNF
jgi:hypothetical protein